MTVEAAASEAQLVAWVRAAASGDRSAAERVLLAIQDRVYRLALRMLGHPQDAEDAAQEVLVIVLTHLGSFRGESAFTTWVWTIAARHLTEARRGRREVDSFEALEERLDGLTAEAAEGTGDPESALFVREVRLRCTEAMILSLDRPSRIALLLGDVFQLSGEEAAAVLGIEPAAYRQRLVRARERLLGFLRGRCGVFDPVNACRCERVAQGAAARGLLRPEGLLFASHPARLETRVLDRATQELTALERAGEVIRDHPDYAAPESLAAGLRKLLESEALELLRH